VFGDSLSDSGNLASLSPVDFPFPFFNNRISDGPVAIDHLASSIGKNALASEEGGNNYAVSGGNLLGNEVQDLVNQVSSYLSKVGGVADEQALYFLMIGGNDLRALRSQTFLALANAEIAVAVDELVSQLMRLHNAGARQFFVVNVANVGRIPETLQRETLDPGVGNRATSYVNSFNQLLGEKLKQYRQLTSDSVFEFDLFTELDKLLDDPDTFGFTQTTVGCFDLEEISFHSDCVFGFRFDRFVFFDNLHPASETNRLIGNAMITTLQNGAPPVRKVPLSGILQLLLD
jgi:phospholipase/lecithinase/hemolysin